MSPIAGGAGVKYASVGGNRTPFYYDPANDEWLSFHEYTFTFSRSNGTVTTELIKTSGQCSPQDNLNGYGIPWKGKVTWLTLRSIGTPVNSTLRVYGNGATTHDEAWDASEKIAYPNANFGSTAFGGTLTVEVRDNGGSSVNTPIVLVGVRLVYE